MLSTALLGSAYVILAQTIEWGSVEPVDRFTEMLTLIGYRAFAILIGLAFAWLGYRLFKAKVRGEAGDLEATWNDKNFVLKRGAPGTFFCLCGAGIVAFNIYKGVELQSSPDLSPEVRQVMMKVISTADPLSENEKDVLFEWLLAHGGYSMIAGLPDDTLPESLLVPEVKG